MNTYPTTLYTPAQVRALDRSAMADHGISGGLLMARAGRCAWRVLRQRYPSAQRIMVLCGGGNNGGDGYVIARLAAEAGLAVDLCSFSASANVNGDAARAAQQALDCLTPVAFSTDRAQSAEVIVDALFGIGLDRLISGELAMWIKAVNQAARPVIAVDVPSGLSAQTGQVLGCAIKATITTTFIGLKQGLFTGQARDYVGEIIFDDLQVPKAIYSGISPSTWRLDEQCRQQRLVKRPKTSHKGDCGEVLLVGGDQGMGGAIRLAAEAAARTGAGLTRCLTRPEHVTAVLAARPELMTHGVSDPVTESEQNQRLFARADILAIGPGLGQGDWGQTLLTQALDAQQPLVVDADGLNGLAQMAKSAGRVLVRDDWVLTPHPGEAARLLDIAVGEIEADRFAAVIALAQRFGGVAVLKGAGTLISDGAQVYLCDRGNPGMASGGMGDVLTGVIAGLWAQGLNALDAACLGVDVHARAADNAAMSGERGLLAGDVVAALREVVNP